jgi:uncharacterized protein (TIGR02391 family)
MKSEINKKGLHTLKSVQLKSFWALSELENEKKDRFTANEIAIFLTESCKVDTSRQAVHTALSRSRGLVSKNKDGYKLMERGLQELNEVKPPESVNLSKKERVDVFQKYDLHPAIKKVSLKEFRDGYYKMSIQNAFVEVIDEVKKRTGRPKDNNGRDLDGEPLMQHVFGCGGAHEPLIKFNDLSTDLERNEQQGLMYLYKGVVGIRNRKAHLNFVQNDPIKTLEYLSLASLLIRHLDEYA